MKRQDESFLILVLLIIQSLFVFFRTLIYIIFDKHFLNLDASIGINNEATIEYVLTIFAVLRVFISGTVLYKRGYQYDILTFILMYLIFSSFLRFYYQYLVESKSQEKIKGYIDRYQDINSLVLFLSSAYILKYVLFN